MKNRLYICVLMGCLASFAVGAIPSVTTKVKKTKASVDMIFEWPTAVALKVEEQWPMLYIYFDKPGQLNSARFSKQLGGQFQMVSISSEGGPLVIRLRMRAHYDIKPTLKEKTWSIRFSLKPDQNGHEQAEDHADQAALSSPESQVPSDPNAINVSWMKGVKNPTLQLDFKSDTNLAAFRRGSHIWIVVNQNARFNTSALKAKGMPSLNNLTTGQGEGFSWLRFNVEKNYFLNVDKQDTSWRLALTEKDLAPTEPLATGIEIGKFGKPLAFSLTGPGQQVFQVMDPDFKETLFVAPLSRSGQAMTDGRAFTQFEYLPTATGVVIRAKSDGIDVSFVGDRLTVSHPQGILVSQDLSQHGEISSTTPLTSLLKFYNWDRTGLPWVVVRDKLREAAQKTKGSERIKSNLDLARFYIESGMDTEASNILTSLERSNPVLKVNPSFMALRAVAFIMERNFEPAKQLLDQPTLAKDPEMRVWHGALDATHGEWRKALDKMQFVLSYIQSYPLHLKHALLLTAAEVNIMMGRIGVAKNLIKSIERPLLSNTQSYFLKFLEAGIAHLEGRQDDAIKLWQEAHERGNLMTKAKAGIAIVRDALSRPNPDYQKQIDFLERLKFLWRGDFIEYEISTLLADLYFKTDQYKKALRTLEYIKRAGAWDEKIPVVDQKITDGLIPIFLKKDHGKKVVEILALYEETKALLRHKPSYKDILANIAAQYEKLELFDRAIDNLTQLKDLLNPGNDKEKLSLKIAELYTLNKMPRRAIETLDKVKLSSPADKQQERFLRAYAFIGDSKTGEALRMIETDHNEKAYEIRSQIYTQEKNWILAGDAYLKMAALTKEEGKRDRSLLLAAACFSLGNHGQGLKEIRERYEEVIQKSPYKDTLVLLLKDNKKLKDPKMLANLLNKFKNSLDKVVEDMVKG